MEGNSHVHHIRNPLLPSMALLSFEAMREILQLQLHSLHDSVPGLSYTTRAFWSCNVSWVTYPRKVAVFGCHVSLFGVWHFDLSTSPSWHQHYPAGLGSDLICFCNLQKLSYIILHKLSLTPIKFVYWMFLYIFHVHVTKYGTTKCFMWNFCGLNYLFKNKWFELLELPNNFTRSSCWAGVCIFCWCWFWTLVISSFHQVKL